MNRRVLITGSLGLVGTALTSALLARGADVVRLDLRGRGKARGDIRNRALLHEVVAGADGVVHLAAVSRVLWGEQDPGLCWSTNVGGLRNVLAAVAASARAPWLIFASSREVYGQSNLLPATEDSPLRPVNVYGYSKVEGERLVVEARRAGVRACTIRLSNVFGSATDHADRVVPAFAHAAVLGQELRVDGFDHTFDFTHIDDVTRGVVALAELLSAGEAPPPPIHFVSGRPTTLGELASFAASIGQSGSKIRPAVPRDFDVARFFGDPSRAKALLGWQPLVQLEDGITQLAQAFREIHEASNVQEVVR